MNGNSRDARARGLRMAIQVAALGAVVLAAAAAGGDAQAATTRAGDAAAAGAAGSDAHAAGLDALVVRSAKSCGCAPCWGPPAPPAADADAVRDFAARLGDAPAEVA